MKETNVTEVEVNTGLMANATIKDNILSGKFKLTSKTGRSKVWNIYRNIEYNGVVIENKVSCKICLSVLNYDLRYTSNLVRHKCYSTINETSVNEVEVNTGLMDNSTIKECVLSGKFKLTSKTGRSKVWDIYRNIEYNGVVIENKVCCKKCFFVLNYNSKTNNLLRHTCYSTIKKTIVNEVEVNTENEKNELMDNATIEENILSGHFKLISKTCGSKLWDIYGNIEYNEVVLENKVCCRKCFSVLNYDEGSTSNLVKHKCYSTINEVEVNIGLIDNATIKECILSGKFKLTSKTGRSKVWDIYRNIEFNGVVIENKVCCKICFSVLNYNPRVTSNLLRHKCYSTVNGTIVNEVEVNTENEKNKSLDNTTIRENILSGQFKLISKTGRSKIWDKYGNIESNGVVIENKVGCKKCFSVLNYDARSLSNLAKHKCCSTINETNVTEIKENELMDNAIIKDNILSGKLKLISKIGRSKIWDIYGNIENNGVMMENKVVCRKCFAVLNYDAKNSSNLVRHKCYITNEINVTEDEVTEIQKEAARLLSQWCIENCRPFRFPQDSGLKQYSEFLVLIGTKYGTNIDIENLLPHPTTISGNIEEIYEETFINVKNEIISVCKNGYGLTSDIWTDDYLKKTYISLTIHYVKNGHLFSRLLGVNSIDAERCTHDGIKSKTENLLEKYNCKLEDGIMVTHRDSNMLAAFNLFPHITCIKHLLNSVIEKAINQVEEVAELCNLCSKLVTYFKNSGENCNLSNSLKSLCPIRWNTVYYLFESVEKNWMEIDNTLQFKNELQRIEKINISYVKGIVDLLKPFDEVSKILADEKHATLHLVYAYIIGLMDNCKPGNNDIEVIKRFKKTLHHNLQTTVFLKLTVTHKIAHFLFPPANKLLQFSEDEKKLIKFECTEHLKMYSSANEVNKSNLKPASVNNAIISPHFKNFVTYMPDSKAEDKITGEIERYQNLNIPFENNFDVINWWHLQQTQFPLLYKLSCKILATPASSAIAERVFSVANQLLSENATNISSSSKAFKHKIFLNMNSDKTDIDPIYTSRLILKQFK